MSTEITTSLIEEINKRHAIALRMGSQMRDVVLGGVNAVREAGVYLLELKEQTRRGEWQPLFSGTKGKKGVTSYAFPFSVETAQIYMRLANKHPDPILTLPDAVTCIKDFMVSSGVLALPDGHGDQTKHHPPSPITLIGGFIAKLQGAVTRWTSEAPIQSWTPDQKARVRGQLEPVVRLYQELA